MEKTVEEQWEDIIKYQNIAYVVFTLICGFTIFSMYTAHEYYGTQTKPFDTQKFRTEPYFEKMKMNNSYRGQYELQLYKDSWERQGEFIFNETEHFVLFVPGSNERISDLQHIVGSIRTEVKRLQLDYKFRFFTINFKNEISINNGILLFKQKWFTFLSLVALREVEQLNKTVILIGHGSGGTSLMSVITNPIYTTLFADILITVGTPMKQLPVYVDLPSYKEHDSLLEAWCERSARHRDLEFTGVASFTGGLADWKAPDQWSRVKNIYTSPVWALDGVSEVGLMSEELLRSKSLTSHIAKLVISYVKNKNSTNEVSPNEVVKRFFESNYKRSLLSVPKLNEIEERGAIKFLSNATHVMNKKYDLYNINATKSEILFLTINSDCVESVIMYRHNSKFSNTKTVDRKKTLGHTTIEMFIYGMVDHEKAFILVKGMPECAYTLKVQAKFQYAASNFYTELIDNPHQAIASFIIFCFLAALTTKETANVRFACNAFALIFWFIFVYICMNFTLSLGYGSAMVGLTAAILAKFLVGFVDWFFVFNNQPELLRTTYLSKEGGLLWSSLCFAVAFLHVDIGAILLLISLPLQVNLQANLLMLPAMFPFVLKLLSQPLMFTFVGWDRSIFLYVIIAAFLLFGRPYHASWYMRLLVFLAVFLLHMSFYHLPLQEVSLSTLVGFAMYRNAYYGDYQELNYYVDDFDVIYEDDKKKKKKKKYTRYTQKKRN